MERSKGVNSHWQGGEKLNECHCERSEAISVSYKSINFRLLRHFVPRNDG